MKRLLRQRFCVLQNLALKYLQIVGGDLNSVRFLTRAML